jgi:hypothetical protein
VAGDLADAEHGFAATEDQREAIVAEKGEAEGVAVEAKSRVRVLGEQEGDDSIELHKAPWVRDEAGRMLRVFGFAVKKRIAIVA